MSRVYSVSVETVAATGVQTLILLETPPNMAVIIHSAEVVAPDDDTNEQLHITLQRLATVATPTGTTLVAAKHAQGDPVSACSVVGDVTAAEPTYDAGTRIGESGASSLGGWRFEPVVAERPEIPPSEAMGLHIVTARGTSKTLTARITYEEVG